MDSQGFAPPQGLAPPTGGRPPAAHARGHARGARKPADPEQRTINRLSMIGSIGFLPFMFQLVGWIPFIGKPLQRTGMWLSETPTSELPKKILPESWHSALQKNAVAPLRRGVGNWLDGIANSGFGKWMQARLEGFTRWRINSNTKAVEAALDGTVNAIKAKPGDTPKGWFQPKPVEHAVSPRMQSHMAPVARELDKAKGLTGKARVGAIGRAMDKVAGILKRTNLTAAERAAAGELQASVNALSRSTGILHGYEQALGKGLRALGSNFVGFVGRTPLIYTVAILGSLATAAAAFLSAKRENRIARQALKELKEDIGDANHPIVVQASKLEKKQSSGRWTVAGLSSLNQGLFIAPMNMMMVMGGSMAISELSKIAVPENQLLNAYAVLKKEERKEIRLRPGDKAEMVRQLVAAVPAVTQQGGLNNRLAKPIAAELVKRNMSVRETMRFLANPDQFNVLAQEMAVKQKEIDARVAAEKAAAEKAAAERVAAAKAAKMNGAAAHTPQAVAPITDKPGLTINTGTGTSQGRVTDLQRTVTGQV